MAWDPVTSAPITAFLVTRKGNHPLVSTKSHKNKAGETLHSIKKAAGLGGRDNVIFNTKTGDVLNQAGEVIGNLHDQP